MCRAGAVSQILLGMALRESLCRSRHCGRPIKVNFANFILDLTASSRHPVQERECNSLQTWLSKKRKDILHNVLLEESSLDCMVTVALRM